MLRMLQIFLLLVVGFLFDSQQSVIVEHHVESVGNIVPTEKKQDHPSDSGYFANAESRSGTVNDQRNNFRTITARTFRTTSSNGGAKWRCGVWAIISTYNNLLTSKRWKDALRIESAPFRFTSACDYYVIALRHIIR